MPSRRGGVQHRVVGTRPERRWLVTDGALYSVDLKSGKATMAGKIAGLNGTLSDIAWVE